MSSVCKALHQLAEPWLYSRFEWDWSKGDWWIRRPQIILLIRSILSNPQLATHMETLIIGRRLTFLNPEDIEIHGFIFAQFDLKEFILFIEKTNLIYGNLWIQKLRSGKGDAFIALLLSQLSNLKYLNMSSDFGVKNQVVGMVLQSAIYESTNHGLPCSQRLREVRLYSDYFSTINNTRNNEGALSFFYLLNIQHLSTSIDDSFAFAWPKHKPSTSTLTSLNLGYIRERDLGKILSATTALKTLRWQWIRTEDYEIPESRIVSPIVDFDLIIEALSHVRNTLEDLSTFAGFFQVEMFLPSNYLAAKGSFKEISTFNSLKRLEISLSFLMGLSPTQMFRFEDFVPRHVEVLILTECPLLQWTNFWIVASAMRSWLEHWKTSTPHLRSISIVMPRRCNDLAGISHYTFECDLTMQSELEILGAETGMQIERIYNLHTNPSCREIL